MAVILSSPRIAGSATYRTIPLRSNQFDGTIGGTAISTMPLTIVAPPTIMAPPSVIRCASANRSRRSSASGFTLRSARYSDQQPKPPSPVPIDEVDPSSHFAFGSPPTDPNPLRLPNIPTSSPQNTTSNVRESASDTVLTSPNKTAVHTIIDAADANIITNPSGQNKGSIFPNFRILQRLATSARLRSAKKNAMLHLNAKKSSKKRNSPMRATSSDLEPVNVQATGLKKVVSNTDEELEWEGSTELANYVIEDEETPTNGFIVSANNTPGSRRRKHAKGATKKLKRSLSARLRSKRRDKDLGCSKPPKCTTPAAIRFSIQSGGSLAVPSLKTIMHTVPEPKKLDIYSNRYRNIDTQNADGERSQGGPKGISQTTQKKSIVSNENVSGSRTSRHLEQASTVYGVLPCQIPDSTSPSGRKKTTSNRMTRIFLSEKQSSSMRDCGRLFPCPPPCSPTPEMLKNVEYVPSLSDLRSQRAIKNRLVTMEKEAKERKQRRQEETKKQEKQLQRDHTAMKKYRQRQEIYALNKVMTQLELKNFEEFCKTMNQVDEKES